ncbi:MAG: DUF4003 family protein [Planctomycetes bacterium]|nr:DUF4003 family protein [Planctomycetota bacterium]
MSLLLAEGEPESLVRDMRARMTELRALASFWDGLSHSLRIFAAASLITQGESSKAFYADWKRARKLFRDNRLPRDGSAELLGFLILRESGSSLSASQVARLAELFREVRKDHRWLLGAGEYPTLALLSQTEAPAGEIARRVEQILKRLEERGFRSRGRLLPISQMLFFAPEADSVVCDRFEAVWREFQAQGLKMFASDYDEVALLCFAPRTPREIVRRVLEHREPIAALRPKPGREASFSLACSTAFLELVGGDPKLRKLSRAQAALQVRSILASRQAAAAAAASS